MSILIEKIGEYLKVTDSESASDIILEISKQYDFLIDQSLYLLE